MKIPVISTGDKVTGTTNTFSLSPTFTTGGNAKFHLEVSKNKDVIFFSVQVHRPLNSITWGLSSSVVRQSTQCLACSVNVL